jgi:DNA-binding CsgD family transcriptional regulator
MVEAQGSSVCLPHARPPGRGCRVPGPRGKLLVRAIQIALRQHEIRGRQEETSPEFIAEQERRRNRAIEFQNLCRAGYRLLRRRQMASGTITAGGSFHRFTGKDQQARRRPLIQEIAWEFDRPAAFVDLTIKEFRRRLHDRIKARREAHIVRYYLEGLPNREIASRVGASVSTVAAFLSRSKAAIKAALPDTSEPRGRPVTPPAREKPSDGLVIDWPAVRATRKAK